ncbi:ABC transporter, ATP-binding protein [Bacillus sp. JCM 19046]|nr:ABC transporter, ATP-binding protein [Bacillus sp. JCM 19045]GAF16364.1 ABC transporter, ATP-binding protein [Bacillus sp. JCM 19046]
MIQLEGVTLSYGVEKETILILEGVDLNITSGEWITLMGPSGSGKTTLLNVLSGLISPSAGTLMLEGADMKDMKQADRQNYFRRNSSSVYQQFRLLPQFSVLENVMLPLVPYKKKSEIESSAKKLIERVGLSHRLMHFPHQLSGGEQQRTSIARALLTSPKILLCDEPTGNLDTKNRDNILTLLSELHQEGLTIVVATHDKAVAQRSDRIVHLKDGMISEGILQS